MRLLPTAAFLVLLITVIRAAPVSATPPGAGAAILAHSDNAESTGSHFLRWIGHFHPPLTAFPIAMFVGAALAEALRIATKAPWLEPAGRWCVIVGAAGAVVAAPLGWAFAIGKSGWVLETHRWLGTCFAAVAVVVLVLSERRFRANQPTAEKPTAFRIALFLAAALVMATGFFGGAMVYGLRAYLWNQPVHTHSAENETLPTTAPAAASSKASGATVTITLTGESTFKPDAVTVPVGTTVRWVNASDDTHTVSNDPKSASDPKNVSTPPDAARFNSGPIRPGGSFEHRFTTPGTYRYVCEPHEEMGMKGTITVTASP